MGWGRSQNGGWGLVGCRARMEKEEPLSAIPSPYLLLHLPIWLAILPLWYPIFPIWYTISPCLVHYPHIWYHIFPPSSLSGTPSLLSGTPSQIGGYPYNNESSRWNSPLLDISLVSVALCCTREHVK